MFDIKMNLRPLLLESLFFFLIKLTEDWFEKMVVG